MQGKTELPSNRIAYLIEGGGGGAILHTEIYKSIMTIPTSS